MTMEFQRISTIQPVVDYIRTTLLSKLSEGTVLWLIPGGSAIEVAVLVSKELAGTDLSGLTVTLTDERYGLVGHADSNWQQLQSRGLMLPGATEIPVLKGESMEKTIEEWDLEMSRLLTTCAYTFGLFGLGADGHTSGILPHSPAVETTHLVSGYNGGSFQRITTTPLALLQLNQAVVYAVGGSKRHILEELAQDRTLADQPAQIFKQIPTVIFNDTIGRKV